MNKTKLAILVYWLVAGSAMFGLVTKASAWIGECPVTVVKAEWARFKLADQANCLKVWLEVGVPQHVQPGAGQPNDLIVHPHHMLGVGYSLTKLYVEGDSAALCFAGPDTFWMVEMTDPPTPLILVLAFEHFDVNISEKRKRFILPAEVPVGREDAERVARRCLRVRVIGSTWTDRAVREQRFVNEEYAAAHRENAHYVSSYDNMARYASDADGPLRILLWSDLTEKQQRAASERLLGLAKKHGIQVEVRLGRRPRKE